MSTTTMTPLERMYDACAGYCEEEGVPLDAEPNGAIHEWVFKNCEYRPSTAFFIVQGIAAAMADRQARREGFENQFHRAAVHMMAKQVAIEEFST